MIENKTEKAMIGILVVALLSLGISVMPEDTHYSNCLNKTMHCERFSGTELTCYPHSDDRKGSKYSVCGWTPIIEDSIPKIVPAKHSSATEYDCIYDGCIIIS